MSSSLLTGDELSDLDFLMNKIYSCHILAVLDFRDLQDKFLKITKLAFIGISGRSGVKVAGPLARVLGTAHVFSVCLSLKSLFFF